MITTWEIEESPKQKARFAITGKIGIMPHPFGDDSKTKDFSHQN
jgi:hypothetical protein